MANIILVWTTFFKILFTYFERELVHMSKVGGRTEEEEKGNPKQTTQAGPGVQVRWVPRHSAQSHHPEITT